MIQGHDIVCLSTTDWDEIWGSRQQIMRRLARHNRVLFVERQLGPEQLLGYAGRLQRKREAWRRGLAEVEPNLFVWSPPTLWPMRNYSSWCSAAGQRRLRGALLPVMQRLGFKRPILWIYQIHSSRLIGRLDESLSVYHCIEQYKGAYTGRKRAVMEREENMALAKADVIFVHSRPLLEEKRQDRPDAHHLPSAADVAHFRTALNGRLPEPAELRDIPRPRAIAMGTFEYRTDVELLHTAFKQRPEWSLVLLGEIKTDLGPLREMRNVHICGRRSFAELPAWLAHADAGLIPYKITPLTNYIDPLKLREYLAAGLPVISTALPDVRPVTNDVYIVDSADSFAKALSDVHSHNTPTDRARRSQSVETETWDARVEALSTVIEAALTRKRGAA